jgi:hypothetical protein
MLEGASEYEYVTILNPLSVDFVGMVGTTRQANTPFTIHNPTTSTRSESDVVRNYGLDLKNPSHTGRINIVNRVPIPSGKTINLLGNEAQVVVRQLVTEILAREGKKLHIADPTARHEVEKRIIITRRNVNDILGSGPINVQDQLKDAVDSLNAQEAPSEPEFPTLSIAQPDLSPSQPVQPEATSTAGHVDGRSKAARAAKTAA